MKAFITWLVTKFLTKRDLFKIIAERWFIESPIATIMSLYNVSTHELHARVTPFSQVAAKHLVSGYESLSHSAYVMVLLSLRERIITCSSLDCKEKDIADFFTRIEKLKEHSSVLKVRKDLTEYVRNNTLYTDEFDITLVVQVLMSRYNNPESTALFITTAGV